MTAGGGAPPRPEESAGAAGESAAPRVAGKTHVGLQRPVNEDAFAVASSADHGSPRSVAVVCDGIAGGAGGDRAATAAAEAALAALVAVPGEPGESALRRAVAAAHRAVCQAVIAPSDGKDEPGTTLVAAVADGRSVDVAWVGDSRAYLVPRSGPAELLTHDHSWVSHVVDAGELTEEEARASKWAQVITRCIGPAEDPDPLRPPEPSLRSVASASPGWLVLCSDGVWGVFAAPEALGAVVRGAPDPDDAAGVTAWVMDRALAAGAADDVTVAVVVL
ncbi:MAG TPA: protein phosphatase 2C domain-containing protein, partial [Acidimicrobiales bacterium]|nr:protein phosphatase 2C domain-containing protein [Acidimicrobiales bacterium]